jgi:predicted Zn-dependent protease
MVAKFPDNPQLYLSLADLYRRKGETDKAEKAMLKMVEIKKDSVPFRLMLAEFYKRQQMFDKAEATLKSAQVDFPKDLQIQVALAELSFDLQKFDQARKLMDAVLASNPANGGATLIKARFLMKDGKNNEAINLITPLTSDYPKWAEPYFYSALAQMRVGNVELAQKSIEQALQNDPTNDRYHTLAAQINLIRGNSNEAGREATLALRINQHNGIAVRILAKALIQAKKYDKAIEFIGKLNQQEGQTNLCRLDSACTR